jgi:hypothetical protein
MMRQGSGQMEKELDDMEECKSEGELEESSNNNGQNKMRSQ